MIYVIGNPESTPSFFEFLVIETNKVSSLSIEYNIQIIIGLGHSIDPQTALAERGKDL
jgi:hypothetical protein